MPQTETAPETQSRNGRKPHTKPKKQGKNYQNSVEPPNSKWNFSALLIDVSFFAIGMAFMDANSILSLLLKRLGAEGLVIGAFATIRALAFCVVQIFVAYATHHLPRQKPALVVAAGVTRLPMLFLPYFIWHAADSPAAQTTALIATIIILSIWAFGDGLGYVPWMEIVARVFSDRTRGRFFATTQLISGLVSIAIAGLLVRNILNSDVLPYPRNYALLFGLSAIMLQISMIGIFLLKENAKTVDPDQPKKQRPPLTDYFRRVPELMRSNPAFVRLSIIQLLVGFGNAAAPFYVLDVTRKFGLSDAWGATFQLMQAVGIMLLIPLWNVVNERFSPVAAIRSVAIACCLTPIIAFTLGSISPWLYGLSFMLMGGSLGWGMWIAVNNYLLVQVEEDERPIFIALINLLYAPSAFFPMFGGLFFPQNKPILFAGIPLLFPITATMIAIGVLLTFGLPKLDTNAEKVEKNTGENGEKSVGGSH